MDVGGPDCDDADEDIHPTATEIWYDGIDQDCDGANDFDQDLDGYEYSTEDCDDEDPTINPGAEDIPDDSIDQDCDGTDATNITDTGGTDGTDDTGDGGEYTGGNTTDDGDKACSHVRSGTAGMWGLMLMVVGLIRRRRE